MQKENDYFLNLMFNPDYSVFDFENAGLNINNTSLQPFDFYKNIDLIKNAPMFQTDGAFDESKMKASYDRALKDYNILANTEVNKQIAIELNNFRNNIFASKESKVPGLEFGVVKVNNPLRQTTGFLTWNILSAPTLTEREIAESNKIFDYDSKKWLDETPEDTWFSNFYNPKVLATWDFDADKDGNPTSDKNEIYYKKGLIKLNEDGEPYYETLGNRSIYGKQVLSGFDTLTREGSFANSIDFLDSDDLDKNLLGIALKTTLQVAPLFIPGVAPWYTGARILIQMGDLVAKVGKMIPGPDAQFLNNLEAFNKSTSFSQSDWVQGSLLSGELAHPWSIESIFNLGSNVALLLAELRFLFTHLPSLLKGNTLGFSKKAREAYIAEKTAELDASLSPKLAQALEKGTDSKRRLSEILESTKSVEAYDALLAYDKSNLSIGEKISKLYMTGITIADSYGEAKEAGLSDGQAALFTLGYGLAEYALLSTGVGEHIMPELRAEKSRINLAIKAIAGLKEPGKNASLATKYKWMLSIINAGRRAAFADFNGLQYGIKTAAVHGLGEGIEEVSEELLLDLSKTLSNTFNKVFGDGLKQMEAFDDGDISKMLNRYALNFVGGLIGGAGSNFFPGMDIAHTIKSYRENPQEAFRDLVQIIQNGGKNDIIKSINSTTWASDDLSSSTYTLENNVEVNVPRSDGEKSLNNKIKDGLTLMVNTIDDILLTEGVKRSSESLITDLAMPAFRRAALGESKVGAYFVRDYVKMTSDLVAVEDELRSLKSGEQNSTDQKSSSNKEEIETKIKNLEKKKKEILKSIELYNDGTMAKEYNKNIMFEMMPAISRPLIGDFNTYLFSKYGKVDIDPKTKELELQVWKEWKESSYYSDQIMLARKVFDLKNEKFSNAIKGHDIKYFLTTYDGTDTIFNDLEEFFLGTPVVTENNIESGLESVLTNLPQTLPSAKIYLEEGRKTLNTISRTNALVSTILTTMDKYRSSEMDLIFEKLSNDYKYLVALSAIKTTEGLNEDLLKALELSNITVNEDGLINESEKNSYISDHIDKLLFDMIVNPETKKWIERELHLQNYMKLPLRLFITTTIDSVVRRFRPKNILQAEEFLKELELPLEETGIKSQRKVNDIIDSTLKSIKDEIDSKAHSNVEELLDLYLEWSGSTLKPSEFLKEIETLLTESTLDLSRFGFSSDVKDKLEEIVQAYQFISAHVAAALIDNGDYDNTLGYNKVVNDFEGNKNLAEIDYNIANAIIQDLAKTTRHIEFILKLYSENSELKLTEQPKIRVKLGELRLSRLKRLIVNIPDNWKGKSELELVINNSTITNNIIAQNDNSKYSLSDELTIKFIEELDNIEEAIKKFLDLNKDRDLTEIINPGNFKLLRTNSEVLNLDTKSLDDSSFIWWLATCQAVSAKTHYKEYLGYLEGTDFKIMPLPAQEAVIRNALAFILNKKIFDRFADAYNNSARKEYNSLSEEELSNLNLSIIAGGKTGIDNDWAILTRNRFLIEGIPGAGKTKGISNILIGILKKYHPKYTKKVAVINIDSEKAKSYALSTGLNEDEFKAYSIESFFNEYCEDYIPSEFNKDGSVKINIDNLKKDPETELYKYRYSIKDIAEPPTLILVDECTRLSQQDALLLNDIEEKFGIIEIDTGDFDQMGVTGRHKWDDDSSTYVRLYRNNQPRSVKVGSSVRTNNTLKDTNISKFRILRNQILKGDLGSLELTFEYYEDQNGLYGDKIASDIEDAKNSIQIMLNSSKEKINYIYYDESSELYQYLNGLNESGPYKDRIYFVKAGASQGSEGEYYIYEPNVFNSDDLQIISSESDLNLRERLTSEYYTAISRAVKGTLILNNPGDNDSIIYEILSKLKTLFSKFDLDEKVKIDFTKKLLDLMKQGHGDLSKIPLFNDEHISTEDVENSKEDEDTDKNGDIEPETRESVEKLNGPTYYPIDNTPTDGNSESDYTLIIHSFNTNETGCITVDLNTQAEVINVNPEDESVGLKPEEGNYRIDSVHGLIKLGLIKLDKNGILAGEEKTKALTLLRRIKAEGLEQEGINNLKIRLLNLLKLTGDFDVRFAVKNNSPTTTVSKNPFNRFFKSAKEILYNIFRGNNNNEELLLPLRHTINMIISNDKGNVFEIPLGIFTSPLTMIKTKGFESINTIYESCKADINKFTNQQYLRIYDLLYQDYDINGTPFSRNRNNPKIKDSVKTLLLLYSRLSDLPNAQNMKNHLRIYLSLENEIFYLDKILNGSTLAGWNGTKVVTGPTIINNNKGEEYDFDLGYLTLNEWIPLSEFKKRCLGRTISKVYTSVSKDITYADGRIAIRKGHPFVLTTDQKFDGSDETLFKEFLQLVKNNRKSHRIRRIYVTTSGASIWEYFKNLNQALLPDSVDSEEVDKTMGNFLTTYRIAEIIFKNGSNFLKVLEDRGGSRLNAWQEFINEMQGKSPNEIVNILDSTCKDLQRKYPALVEKMVYKSTELEDGNEVEKEHHIIDNSNIKLRSKLNRFLRYVVLSKRHIESLEQANRQGFANFIQQDGKLLTDLEFTNLLLQAIENDIKNTTTWHEGKILYNLTLSDEKEVIEGYDFALNNYDVSTDSDSHGPIMVNGKIDTSNIILTALPILSFVASIKKGEEQHMISEYTNFSKPRTNVGKPSYSFEKDVFAQGVRNKKIITDLLNDEDKNSFEGLTLDLKKEKLLKIAENNNVLINFDNSGKINTLKKVDSIIYLPQVYKLNGNWYDFNNVKITSNEGYQDFIPVSSKEIEFKEYLDSLSPEVKSDILDRFKEIANSKLSAINRLLTKGVDFILIESFINKHFELNTKLDTSEYEELINQLKDKFDKKLPITC